MCATCCISTALPGWSGIGGDAVARPARPTTPDRAKLSCRHATRGPLRCSASLVSDGWFSYLLLLRCVPAGICTRIVLGSTIAGTAKIAVWPSDIDHSIGTLRVGSADGEGEDTCDADQNV